jgi:hypothetical protein
MSITTKWYDNEHTIIHNLHEGSWSWNDFHKAMTDIEAMLETVPEKAFIIVDIQKSTMMPGGVPSQFHKLRSFWTNPKIEGAVMVGMNRLIQIFFNLFIQVSPQIRQLMDTAPTLEAAEKLIQERRGTKPETV